MSSPFAGHRPHMGVNEKGHLTLGGVDSVVLAEEFGTPLYVMDEGRIRERYREFRDAFSGLYPKVEIKYAYKANTSLAVCHILRQEDCGADVLSKGEIETALMVGLKSEKMIFTGNNKSDEELELAVEKGITINLDAVHELERLKGICTSKEKRTRISFRINPSVSPETHPRLATGLRESKFGIHEGEVVDAYGAAMDFELFHVAGIHMHIGSQILDTAPYKEATGKLFDLIGRLKEELNLDMEFVDLGGGLGIGYEGEKGIITPKDLASAIVPIVRKKIDAYSLEEPVLYLEPGRYIVGDSAIMLSRVSTVKRTPYKKFVGIDAGFNVFPRPVLYDAYHEVAVANKADSPPEEEVDIAGNVCESGDILARGRMLPKIDGGDLVAFLDAGAYCFMMASQYNLRPRPAEILVHDKKYELIREREDFQDLIAKQRVPKRLEG